MRFEKMRSETSTQDNLFENIEVGSRICQVREIKKCGKENFIYNIMNGRFHKQSSILEISEMVFEADNYKTFQLSEEFVINKKIGEGSFGEVYSAYDQKLKIKAALKFINKTKQSSNPESPILKRVDHPNIVKFIRSFENKYFWLMEFELMEGGSLKDLIQERYNREEYYFNELEVSTIIKGITQALDYMHFLPTPLIHRDIKPGK